MNLEYFSKAEKYDIYTVLGCEYRDSREIIKQKAKILLKMSHPDKVAENLKGNINDTCETSENSYDFQSEFFNLVNYSFKTLYNPILRTIYNQEGHRGLKIFYNYRDIFDKILANYPSKALEDENDDNFIEAVEKVMKKLRKIKLDLIQTNFEKYTNERQSLELEINLSDYLRSEHRDIDDEIDDNQKIMTDSSSNFLDIISQSAEIKSKSKLKSKPNDYSYRKEKEIYNDEYYSWNSNSKVNFISVSKIKLNHSSFVFHTNDSLKNNIPKFLSLIKFFPYRHKFTMQMEYDTENKLFRLYPKYSLLFSIGKNKSKFYINTLKKKIQNKLYFNKIQKIPILQAPFIKSKFKYPKNLKNKISNSLSYYSFFRIFSLSIGNKYKDEACKVKTSYTLPKNEIKFFFLTYLKDLYNSTIGFNLKNLKTLAIFYNGQLTPDLEVSAKVKFMASKCSQFMGLFMYKMSKRFKLQISNQFNISFSNGNGLGVLNIISVGLNFKSFSFQIPLIISKIENPASINSILLMNILINGIATAFYYLKKIIL